jgi:hypothetical protein
MSRPSALVVPLLLMLVSVSGCLVGGADSTAEKEARERRSREVEGFGPSGDVAGPTDFPWSLLGVNATPAGGLAGYAWTIPNGSYFSDRYGYYQSFGIEIAPRIVSDVPVRLIEWHLLVFQRSGAEALKFFKASSQVGVEWSNSSLGAPRDSRSEPGLGVQALQIARAGAYGATFVPKEGSELILVLAARTEPAARFDVGIVPIARYQHQPAPNSSTFEEFLSQRNGNESTPARLLGTGEGIQFCHYSANNALGLSSWSWRTAAIKIERTTPSALPYTQTQSAQYSCRFESVQGYSLGFGSYLAFESVGYFDVAIASRGREFSGRGIIAEEFLLYVFGSPAAGFTGRPLFSFELDGLGASYSRMKLHAVQAPFTGLMTFSQLDLGATLEQLTGFKGPQEAALVVGQANNTIPPLMTTRLDGDSVVHEFEDGSAFAVHPFSAARPQ